jgi:hypothetical protein
LNYAHNVEVAYVENAKEAEGKDQQGYETNRHADKKSIEPIIGKLRTVFRIVT